MVKNVQLFGTVRKFDMDENTKPTLLWSNSTM